MIMEIHRMILFSSIFSFNFMQKDFYEMLKLISRSLLDYQAI